MFITSDSKNAPYHWRNELNFTEVQNIQEKCRYLLTFSNSSSNSWFLHEHIFFFSQAMDLWGYRKATSPEELKDLDTLNEYNLW